MKKTGKVAERSLQRATALKDYLRAVAELPRRGPAEREALGARLAAGDGAAAILLIECYLPLVLDEAAQLRGLGLRFEALIAVGNRALARSLRRSPVPAELSLRRKVRRELRAALAQTAA